MTELEELPVELVGLDRLQLDPENARLHGRRNLDSLKRSLHRFGQRKPVVATGDSVIRAGNGTLMAIQEMVRENVDLQLIGGSPRWREITGIWVTWFPGTPEEARAYAIADNRTSDLSEWDTRLLLTQLEAVHEHDKELLEAAGYEQDEWASLLSLQNEADGIVQRDAEIATKPPARIRQMPVDCIYTANSIYGSIMAWASGWMWGLRSTAFVGPGVPVASAGNPTEIGGVTRDHGPDFIDCHWHDYDHDQHVRAVTRWRPKYATVRDLLTAEQAERAGVEYFSLEQTLDMAAEIAAGTPNVILIPKYDCLDQLPERIGDSRVVLGFSVPTRYGGTPLPPSAFAGRPIHLLGGTWDKQHALLALLGDDVISLDHNASLMLARYGQVVTFDGHAGFDEAFPGLYVGWLGKVTISLCTIGEILRRDFAAPNSPTPPDFPEEELVPEAEGDR